METSGRGRSVSRLGAAFAAGALALLALATGVQAADRRIDVSSAKVHRIFLPMSQSVTVELNRNLGDMVVADSRIADAQPMTDRVLYVIGKGAGTTTVALFSDDKRSLGVLEVEVGVDIDDMAQAIRQVAPRSKVTVGSVNGKVRLGGRVKDGATLAAIMEVAAQYGPDSVINSVTVEDSQQVNLEVRVLEVARNAGREVGVAWHIGRKGDTVVDSVLPDDLGGQSVKGLVGNALGVLASGNAPFGTVIANVIDAGVNVDVIVRALEDKRLARRLAEPNLTALSGETASFLAGGEVPIPVARDDDEITIEFKEYMA